MAQDNNTNSSLLNPITIKNFTPTQFLPQSPTAQGVAVQKFFEYQRYLVDGAATPANGYNAYPTRTPEYISNIFSDKSTSFNI